MVDLFLGQADRHERNIEFIVVAENNKKVIYPAPMFDNGFMAKLDYSSRSISELKQILKENPDYAKTYTGSEPYFTAIKKDMNTSIYGDYDYIETCFKDTIDTAQDYSVKELMLNLAKMDITKEIAEFEKAYKTQIPEDYKYVMQIVIGNRIDAFRKVYSLEQNTNLFSKETDFEK